MPQSTGPVEAHNMPDTERAIDFQLAAYFTEQP